MVAEQLHSAKDPLQAIEEQAAAQADAMLQRAIAEATAKSRRGISCPDTDPMLTGSSPPAASTTPSRPRRVSKSTRTMSTALRQGPPLQGTPRKAASPATRMAPARRPSNAGQQRRSSSLTKRRPPSKPPRTKTTETDVAQPDHNATKGAQRNRSVDRAAPRNRSVPGGAQRNRSVSGTSPRNRSSDRKSLPNASVWQAVQVENTPGELSSRSEVAVPSDGLELDGTSGTPLPSAAASVVVADVAEATTSDGMELDGTSTAPPSVVTSVVVADVAEEDVVWAGCEPDDCEVASAGMGDNLDTRSSSVLQPAEIRMIHGMDEQPASGCLGSPGRVGFEDTVPTPAEESSPTSGGGWDPRVPDLRTPSMNSNKRNTRTFTECSAFSTLTENGTPRIDRALERTNWLLEHLNDLGILDAEVAEGVAAASSDAPEPPCEPGQVLAACRAVAEAVRREASKGSSSGDAAASPDADSPALVQEREVAQLIATLASLWQRFQDLQDRTGLAISGAQSGGRNTDAPALAPAVGSAVQPKGVDIDGSQATSVGVSERGIGHGGAASSPSKGLWGSYTTLGSTVQSPAASAKVSSPHQMWPFAPGQQDPEPEPCNNSGVSGIQPGESVFADLSFADECSFVNGGSQPLAACGSSPSPKSPVRDAKPCFNPPWPINQAALLDVSSKNGAAADLLRVARQNSSPATWRSAVGPNIGSPVLNPRTVPASPVLQYRTDGTSGSVALPVGSRLTATAPSLEAARRRCYTSPFAASTNHMAAPAQSSSAFAKPPPSSPRPSPVVARVAPTPTYPILTPRTNGSAAPTPVPAIPVWARPTPQQGPQAKVLGSAFGGLTPPPAANASFSLDASMSGRQRCNSAHSPCPPASSDDRHLVAASPRLALREADGATPSRPLVSAGVAGAAAAVTSVATPIRSRPLLGGNLAAANSGGPLVTAAPEARAPSLVRQVPRYVTGASLPPPAYPAAEQPGLPSRSPRRQVLHTPRQCHAAPPFGIEPMPIQQVYNVVQYVNQGDATLSLASAVGGGSVCALQAVQPVGIAPVQRQASRP